jgi:hypothetical protein
MWLYWKSVVILIVNTLKNPREFYKINMYGDVFFKLLFNMFDLTMSLKEGTGKKHKYYVQ